MTTPICRVAHDGLGAGLDGRLLTVGTAVAFVGPRLRVKTVDVDRIAVVRGVGCW